MIDGQLVSTQKMVEIEAELALRNLRDLCNAQGIELRDLQQKVDELRKSYTASENRRCYLQNENDRLQSLAPRDVQ